MMQHRPRSSCDIASVSWGLTGDFSCSWRHISKKESDLSTDFLALFLPASPEMVSPSEMHWNQSGWMARWMSMNLEAVISMRPELPHRETICTRRTGMNSSCKGQQILRVKGERELIWWNIRYWNDSSLGKFPLSDNQLHLAQWMKGDEWLNWNF